MSGDRVAVALGWVALQRGEVVEAQTWAEQSLALCRAAHDPTGLAWSLFDLGHLAFVRGELAQALISEFALTLMVSIMLVMLLDYRDRVEAHRQTEMAASEEQ